jgi:tRNA(Ile)-lysidine synthase
MRYDFFASAAAARNLNRVAVAQTADDQAETVLAHLLRGTGPAGLAGIYPVAGLTIRPLLEVGRQDLRDYLISLGRNWREDATNQDTTRMRARIRHQLLPLLRRDFESSSVIRLARLAGLAREDESFWSALEENRFKAITFVEPRGGVSVKIADLLCPLPALDAEHRAATRTATFHNGPALALTRRLVRRIVAELRGNRRQVTARHVQDVLDLATYSQSGCRIGLPGITVERAFDRLVFSRSLQRGDGRRIDRAEIPNCGFEYAIPEPAHLGSSTVVVPEIRRRFSLKLVDWPVTRSETVECGQYAGNTCSGIIDCQTVQWPLKLRSWRPGDSYRPHGHLGVRKLKRLFAQSRVPRSSRDGWPVLISGGHLVWVSGYPIAEDFAPRDDTRTALLVVEEELGEQELE